MSSGKGKRSKSPKLNPCQTCLSHECVFIFLFVLQWASLTQPRNFERPQGSSNSTDNGQQLWYNYVPTEWICIIFLVLFGVSTCRVRSASSTDRC
jgi:hypothetical protein